MAKILLRSGYLDDFQAVGGSGQAVFDSAQQVRETLRLRKQHVIAECLAIPQLNDESDRVDWYAPTEGSVISWKAATAAQRESALRYLESVREGVWQLVEKCLQSGKTTQQLFGSLLEKSLQFPGENHLFLVDGKPVISFWGFVNLNENARNDVFECLREVEPEPVIEQLSADDEPPVQSLTFYEADAPLLAAPEPIIDLQTVVAPEPQPVPQPESVADTAVPPRRLLWRWALPLAAAVIIAAVAVPLMWPAPSQPIVSHSTPVASPVMPTVANTLPLQRASHTEAPVPVVKDVVLTPIPKDALVMSADQLRAGTTRFLNGNWRALLTMKEAPSLRYQIKDNKGTARLVHSGNIVCRASIFSGLHQNGELLIKSRGPARCTDGSRFPMPEVTCKAGLNDVAVCTGRFGADAVVPLTFKNTGA